MLFLTNAFSINMLQQFPCNISITPLNVTEAAELWNRADGVNAIGHESTDTIVRSMLTEAGANIAPGQRINVALKEGDILIVAQYIGPRLPEGATELPPGAEIKFFLLTIS